MVAFRPPYPHYGPNTGKCSLNAMFSRPEGPKGLTSTFSFSNPKIAPEWLGQIFFTNTISRPGCRTMPHRQGEPVGAFPNVRELILEVPDDFPIHESPGLLRLCQLVNDPMVNPTLSMPRLPPIAHDRCDVCNGRVSVRPALDRRVPGSRPAEFKGASELSVWEGCSLRILACEWCNKKIMHVDRVPPLAWNRSTNAWEMIVFWDGFTQSYLNLLRANLGRKRCEGTVSKEEEADPDDKKEGGAQKKAKR